MNYVDIIVDHQHPWPAIRDRWMGLGRRVAAITVDSQPLQYSDLPPLIEDAAFGLMAQHPQSEFIVHTTENAVERQIMLWACALVDKCYVPYNKRITDLQTYLGDRWCHVRGLSRPGGYQAQRATLPALHPTHPTLAVFTSGSTGAAKCAALGLRQLLHSLQGTVEFYGETLASSDRTKRFVQTLPHHHIGGLMVGFRALLIGGTLIDSTAFGTLADLKTTNPDVISLVPSQLDVCLSDPELTAVLKPTALVIVSGASCPRALLIKARDLNLPVSYSYGATEAGSQIAAQRPAEDLDAPLTVMRYRQVRSVGGQLQLAGLTMFSGYLHQGQVLERTPDAWFATGDHGQADERGLTVEGRSDGVYKCSGHKVAAAQLSQIVRRSGFAHHRVRFESHARWGHVPVVHIYRAPSAGLFDPQLSDLQDQLDRAVPRSVRPVRVEVSHEFELKFAGSGDHPSPG